MKGPTADTPGPGVYAVPSSIGNQASSRKPNANAFSFGARTGDPPQTRTQSPGPGTYVAPSAFGNQAMSTKANGPAKSFGQRLPDPKQRSDASSPAPGAYELPSGRSSRAATFGIGERLKHPTSDAPGPGTHEVPSAFGPQADSTKPTHGGPVLAGRLPDRAIETASPGPGAYDVRDGVIGNGARTTTFGNGSRTGDRIPRSTSPGPGAYNPKREYCQHRHCLRIVADRAIWCVFNAGWLVVQWRLMVEPQHSDSD